MTPGKIILYGSYGYTGQLIAEECRSKNLEVVLSGRNEIALRQQSEKTGYSYEVVDVDDSEALQKLLSRGAVVIHCGGPFIHTAEKMVRACLHEKIHYTDITGESDVFELLPNFDNQAKEAGIMVMPGTGFDVVPSDCLALHLKNRLPAATHLQLAFASSVQGLSRGTNRTMMEGLGEGSKIRKDGKLVTVALGSLTRAIDFGPFKLQSLNIPWGDISTAWRSTSIPNIEVYIGSNEATIKKARKTRYINWLLRMRWVREFLKKQVDKKPAGPSSEKREKGRTYLWGQCSDQNGNVVISYLETPNGYTLTARSAVHIVEKILNGNFKTGYQTPATAYGADLILEIKDTSRRDS